MLRAAKSNLQDMSTGSRGDGGRWSGGVLQKSPSKIGIDLQRERGGKRVADSRVTTGMKQDIVIYSRVSTDRQNHDSQLAELRAYCANRGWSEPEEIVDTISGTKNSRTGLDRLMAAVRRGKVKVVVCFKLDRLGRSLSHLVQVLREFVSRRVVLIVPNSGIDTSKVSSKVFLDILEAFSEFKHAVAVESINAGLAHAKARGVQAWPSDEG
jgi:DNA invertase Pin-like site-specific DNA recombinase